MQAEGSYVGRQPGMARGRRGHAPTHQHTGSPMELHGKNHRDTKMLLLLLLVLLMLLLMSLGEQVAQ